MSKAKVYSSNGGVVRMREAPSTTAKIIMTIEPRTEVELVQKLADWSKIKYMGREGYMMNKYLITDASLSPISKADLQKIYNSLKDTLDLLNEILK